jgi:hypothetical protein
MRWYKYLQRSEKGVGTTHSPISFCVCPITFIYRLVNIDRGAPFPQKMKYGFADNEDDNDGVDYFPSANTKKPQSIGPSPSGQN